MLVYDHIRSLRLSLDKLDLQLLKLHIQLEKSMYNNTWDYWDHCSIGRAEMAYRRIKTKHNSKLVKLEQHEIGMVRHDLHTGEEYGINVDNHERRSPRNNLLNYTSQISWKLQSLRPVNDDIWGYPRSEY